MEKYVISMYDKGQNEAGPKAKVDAEDFWPLRVLKN